MACIHDNPERSDRRDIHEAQHAVDIGRPCRRRDIAACSTGLGGAEGVGLGQPFDFGQRPLRIERGRARTHQLHPVIIHRVVRGGDADPARGPGGTGGGIDLFGAAQAKVQNLNPLVDQCLRHRVGKGFGCGADIAAEHHRLGSQSPCKSASDPGGDAFVQFGAKPPPDVIGLETGQAHPRLPWPRA